MGVIVHLFFMSLMEVKVRAVVTRVLVVMYRGISMIMFMFVFVEMLMGMNVRVLVRMRHVLVGVFVGMCVGMLMGMKVFVLVVAFHWCTPFVKVPFAEQSISNLIV